MALDYNGQLRRAFVQLHDILVGSLNSAPLVDQLFASGVLGSEQHLELFEVCDRSEKTRRLLSMLYGSQHPQAFIQLRRSMKRHESSRWLVDEIDRHARPLQTRVNEPPKCGAVVNVALLDDTVFVVSELSDRIRVFDVRSTPCTELDEIRVDGLKWPTDIAVCPDDGRLFVADSFYFNKCVWQIDVSSWPLTMCRIRMSCRPWSLNVSSHRLLVTPISRRDFRIKDPDTELPYGQMDPKANKRIEFPIELDVRTVQMKKRNSLYMYNVSGDLPKDHEDGCLIKRIILPADLDSHMIHHAIETARGTFFVSHSVESGGGSDGKDQNRCQYAAVRDDASHPVLDRISEVDDRGQVIRVYGGIRGCGPKQFNWPSHMALAPLSCGSEGDAFNENDFSLLVVDKNNCRVIVLDAELRFEHVLLNKDLDRLLANPWRLSYSSTTGRLVVGLENGVVFAYGETIDHRRRRLSRSREFLE